MFPDCLIYALTVLYTLTVLCGVQGLLSSDTIAIEHGLGQTALSDVQIRNIANEVHTQARNRKTLPTMR